MSKPLSEHVTRAEAAKVLRLSVRQVDRLAEAGKLTKVPLSASRGGFDRQDFDPYLQSLGNDGGGYVSAIEALTIGLGADLQSAYTNRAAAILNMILAERFPAASSRSTKMPFPSCGTPRWAMRQNRFGSS
jgi:hypothetical protein